MFNDLWQSMQNDVRSQLNATAVARIVRPRRLAELQAVITP